MTGTQVVMLLYLCRSYIYIYIYIYIYTGVSLLLEIMTKFKNTCGLYASQGFLHCGCVVRLLGCRKFY
jgi:hypothetical protein